MRAHAMRHGGDWTVDLCSQLAELFVFRINIICVCYTNCIAAHVSEAINAADFCVGRSGQKIGHIVP